MIKATTDRAKQALSAGFGVARGLADGVARLAGVNRTTPEGIEAATHPGSTPGIESISGIDRPPEPGRVQIHCLDSGADRVETRSVTDLVWFLAQPRPDRSNLRWLDVVGLHPYVINQLRHHFKFHTLAAEDVLRQGQRPKVEDFPDHLFLVLRMLVLKEGKLVDEQLAIFLYRDVLISLRQGGFDIWAPIRSRFEKPQSRLRQLGPAYLLYALLDAVVDHCFPILERYGDLLEELEREVLEKPTASVQHSIHTMKRELALFRRMVWPMRDLLNTLQREDDETIPGAVQPYLRDVYDHTVQVMEIVESYRESAGGLNDLYMSAVSNRMNEIMKVLTIMASFFIPITFIAGVYGMNFEYIPELKWKYSYLVFWLACGSVSVVLGVFFYRKGWLSGK